MGRRGIDGDGDYPRISVICWSNNKTILEKFLFQGFVGGTQLGEPDIEMIVIAPSQGCKTMGEAYELGRKMATHPVKVYIHQDIYILDRSFMLKVWEMLKHKPISGIGIFGSDIDTGGAYFMCHPRHQWGVSRDLNMNGLHRAECAPVKIVDGVMLATDANYPWAQCYEKTHLFVEDYCMQIREGGGQIWTIDSSNLHKSSGTVDDTFWRSMQTFRRRWKHMIGDAPPTKMYRDFYERHEKQGTWNKQLLQVGAWGAVWDEWRAQRIQALAATG